ncbi:hypothetical protein MIR68_000937 [Amoeboaphelidium protococcarum]|nr:hypothetical protein MIR68_000937 [Amoeboaphelidium protococcarum]
MEFEVFRYINQTQTECGVQNEDYLRYAQSCTNRVRALRKRLGLMQGTNKTFVKVPVENSLQALAIDDSDNEQLKQLLILGILECERYWSRGMYIKQEVMNVPRKRHAAKLKFKRAGQFAEKLAAAFDQVKVLSQSTASELNAYKTWLVALGFFEHGNKYTEALPALQSAQKLFEKLLSRPGIAQRELMDFQQKIDQLSSQIRYSLHKMDAADAMNNLQVDETDIETDEDEDQTRSTDAEESGEVQEQKPTSIIGNILGGWWSR